MKWSDYGVTLDSMRTEGPSWADYGVTLEGLSAPFEKKKPYSANQAVGTLVGSALNAIENPASSGGIEGFLESIGGAFPEDASAEPVLTDVEQWEQSQIQELATGTPHNIVDTAPLRQRYEQAKGTAEEQDALVDWQIAERRNKVKQEQLNERRKKMFESGYTQEQAAQYRMKERYERDMRNPSDRLLNLPFMRGLTAGAETIASVPIELANRVAGNDEYADQLARGRQDTGAYNAYVDAQQGKALGYTRQAVEMLTKYTPAGALGGTAGIIGVVAAETQATKWHEGRQAGMDDGQAAAYAGVHAIKDALLTWLGGKVAGTLGARTSEQALGMAGGAARDATFKGFLKQYVTGLGVEAGVEELPQYFGELLLDKMMRDDYQPKSWDEISRDVTDVLAMTALMQGVTGPLETSEPVRQFAENPSRRTAKAAGIAELVPTAKDRERVAKSYVESVRVRTDGNPGAFSGEQLQIESDQATETSPDIAPPSPSAPSPESVGFTPQNFGEAVLNMAGDAASKLKGWMKENMLSGAGRPELVNDLLLARDGFLGVQATQMESSLRAMERAVRKAYKLKWKDKIPQNIGENLQQALNDPKSPVWQTLPLDVAVELRKMRDHIDNLSSFVANLPDVQQDLTLTIQGNLGQYTTRTYEKFVNPDRWKKKALADPQIMAEFAAEVRQQSPNATDDDIRTLAEVMLNQDTLSVASIESGPTARTNEYVKVLKKRKDLSPAVRKLYGEHKNAFQTYANTIGAASQLVAHRQFAAQLAEEGVRSGLFKKDMTQMPPNSDTTEFKATTPHLQELNGLYMPKELAVSLEKLYTTRTPGLLYKMWVGASAGAKYSKTVGSWSAQMRNFRGNIPSVVANGILNPKEILKAVDGVILSDFGKVRKSLTPDQKQRYVRLGLWEDVSISEVRKMVGYIAPQLSSYLEGSQPTSTRKRVSRAAAKLYQASDVVFKVAQFEAMRPKYRKAFPNLSENELDLYVAKIVRDTLPTYSNASKAAREISRSPIVGPFALFHLEAARTMVNRARITAEELTSGNSELRKLGAQKLAGQLVAYGTYAALAQTFSIGDEEDDALRELAPPWQRNAQRVYETDIENGRVNYTDLGYENPFSVVFKPVTAMMHGRSWGEVASEIVEPIMSEDLLTGAALSVLFNQQSEGGDVYGSGLDEPKQLEQMAWFLYERFEPGTLTSMRRVLKGARGEVSRGGKEYELDRELMAMLLGQRRDSLVIAQATPWRHKEFNGRIADSQGEILKEFSNRGTPDLAELADIYRSADAARRQAFDEWHEFMHKLPTIGVENPIADALRAESLNNRNKTLVRRAYAGQYVPYLPSKATLRQWMTLPGGAERVALIQQLYEEALTAPTE